jgi:hypothetical protein
MKAASLIQALNNLCFGAQFLYEKHIYIDTKNVSYKSTHETFAKTMVYKVRFYLGAAELRRVWRSSEDRGVARKSAA